MTLIEFLLGVAYNLRWAFTMIAFISVLGLIGTTIGLCVTHFSDENGKNTCTDTDRKMARKLWLLAVFLLIFSIIPASVPDVEDLWKIRIGMIKLQLASPENVEKGAAEIIRIGHKLECRYIGCDEKKEEKK